MWSTKKCLLHKIEWLCATKHLVSDKLNDLFDKEYLDQE